MLILKKKSFSKKLQKKVNLIFICPNESNVKLLAFPGLKLHEKNQALNGLVR